MAGERVNGGRNSSVLSALLQNQRSSEPLDSLFLSRSSTSSFAHFLGSRLKMYVEEVDRIGHCSTSMSTKITGKMTWENPAKDLGLQPRQVAIWFQNRWARWKTKHLEKDYEVLQANYNNLKANCENLSKENDKLKAEQHQAAGESDAGRW
ncbi:hypothetical protein TB2_044195 [Malus domestica]